MSLKVCSCNRIESSIIPNQLQITDTMDMAISHTEKYPPRSRKKNPNRIQTIIIITATFPWINICKINKISQNDSMSMVQFDIDLWTKSVTNQCMNKLKQQQHTQTNRFNVIPVFDK